MEFKVLGPLQVMRGDQPVHVGSAYKMRLLLGVLLAQAGAPLSQDALISALWTDNPPPSARRNLHQYINRLRMVLGSEWITSGPGGYALDIDPETTDAVQFARRVEEGTAAFADGDHALASKLMRDALDLWRGDAYAEFRDCGLIMTAATRLEQDRLTAYEQWAEAELALDRPRPVIPVLSGLFKDHPYAENLVSLQMQALACNGRPAEALELFRTARETLREQLGIEPGPGLQAVHQSILRGEDPRPAPRRIPRQLPPDVSHFVGREREIVALNASAGQRMSGSAAVLAVYGAGGTGKSALAVRVAHNIAHQFPDGNLYLDLQGATPGVPPLEPLEGLARWLRALGVHSRLIPANVAEAAALYRQMTAKRRLLLFLDNAYDAAQVRPFQTSSPDCRVIVTSRSMLSTLDNASHVHLTELTVPQAQALLGRFDRRAMDPAQLGPVLSIVDSCGRLPLAIRIVGARLAGRPDWTLAEVAQRLSDEHTRLDELQLQDMSVRTSLSVSRAGLDDEAALLLDHIGALDCPEVTTPIAAALLDRPLGHAEGIVDQLASAQLVTPGRYRRYVLPDLVRLYARESQLSSNDRESALLRVLDHYRITAWHAGKLLIPHNQRHPAEPSTTAIATELSIPDEAYRWLDGELGNITALVKRADSAATAAVAAELLTTIGLPLLAVHCRWGEMQALSRLVIAFGKQLGDSTLEARGHEELALALCAQGIGEEAIANATRAVELLDETADPRDLFGATLALGYGYATTGQQDKFHEQLQLALGVCREHGYLAGEASALDHLGRLSRHQGKLAEAIEFHNASLAIFRTVTSPMSMAGCLQNLGWAILDSGGDANVAMGHFRESMTIGASLTFPLLRATGLWGIGAARHTLGQTAAARSAWHDAVILLQRIGAVDADEAALIWADDAPAVPRVIRWMV